MDEDNLLPDGFRLTKQEAEDKLQAIWDCAQKHDTMEAHTKLLEGNHFAFGRFVVEPYSLDATILPGIYRVMFGYYPGMVDPLRRNVSNHDPQKIIEFLKEMMDMKENGYSDYALIQRGNELLGGPGAA